MAPVAHARCQLCARRIESNAHRRTVGNQQYRRMLCQYRKLNGDSILEAGKICERCHTSLSKCQRTWRPPYFMQLVRKNDDDEIEEGTHCSPPSQVTENHDHQVPDIEMVNIEDLNQDPSNTNMDAVNETNSHTISTQSTTLSSLSSRSNKVEVHTVSSSQRHCCVCHKESGRQSIPKKAIVKTWLSIRVFVSFTNRTCKNHLQNQEFDAASLSVLQAKATLSSVNGSEFMELTEELSKFCEELSEKSRLTMEDTCLKEEEVKTLFSLTRDQFEDLHQYVAADLRKSSNRTTRDALAMYLLKLRLNLPQAVIRILFGISSQSKVSEAITAVSESLLQRFTPKFLGYRHLNEMQLENHQSEFLRTIFGLSSTANIIVADGTYIYVQKSSGI